MVLQSFLSQPAEFVVQAPLLLHLICQRSITVRGLLSHHHPTDSPKTYCWLPGIPTSSSSSSSAKHKLCLSRRTKRCRPRGGDSINCFAIRGQVTVSLGLTKCSFPTPVKFLGMDLQTITNSHNLGKKKSTMNLNTTDFENYWYKCSKVQVWIQNLEAAMPYPLCYSTRFHSLHGTLFWAGLVFSCHGT